jgi:ATP-binding protein involved in chromosome partitioning
MFGKDRGRLTEADVLAALKGVKDPEIHRDLVDLGMVKDVRVGDGFVSLTVNLTTPACPLKGQIEREVRSALESRLGADLKIAINMGAEVRGKNTFESGDIPGIKNVLAVGSGKGGVGKSTMAAAIAFGLQGYGAKVGLMDADVYGPSIPTLVGVHDRPMARGDRIQPLLAEGLKLMSMGFLLEPEKAVIMRGPMLHGIMQQFLRQVDWGDLDYLVIDLPPGTGDVPLTLSQTLPLTGAVVVCTPQEVALADALRALGMFRQLKVPILGVIENMSFYELPDGSKQFLFGEGGARRMAEKQGVPFLGEVPLQMQVRERGDAGQLRRVLDEDAPSRPYLRHVVEQLAAQISVRNLKTPKLPKLEILG